MALFDVGALLAGFAALEAGVLLTGFAALAVALVVALAVDWVVDLAGAAFVLLVVFAVARLTWLDSVGLLATFFTGAFDAAAGVV